MIPKFSPGQLVATPGALEALGQSGQTPDFFVQKHLSGDWGEVDDEGRLVNEQALKKGQRLLSVYTTLKGLRLWIITEANRSSTCILLPEEY